MKKIKETKLDFVKCTVLEFKSMLNIKGGSEGYNTEPVTNGIPQISTRVCQSNNSAG